MSTDNTQASDGPPLAGATGSERFWVGQAVTWMHCTSNGRRLGFHTREGTILQIEINCALVKNRSGRRQFVGLEDLTPAGEKTAVTKLFEDLAGSPIAESPNAAVSDGGTPFAPRPGYAGKVSQEDI